MLVRGILLLAVSSCSCCECANNDDDDDGPCEDEGGARAEVMNHVTDPRSYMRIVAAVFTFFVVVAVVLGCRVAPVVDHSVLIAMCAGDARLVCCSSSASQLRSSSVVKVSEDGLVGKRFGHALARKEH